MNSGDRHTVKCTIGDIWAILEEWCIHTGEKVVRSTT
jgi:hypothetical protein